MTKENLMMKSNLARMRELALWSRGLIAPDSFDGSKTTYNHNIGASIAILGCAISQRDLNRKLGQWKSSNNS